MNFLVTGATGFIGRHLVQELSKNKKHEIYCLVRNFKKAQKLKPLGIRCIYADITQNHTLSKVLRHKIDVVFHCAGYVSGKDKDMLYKVNVLGTENICELSQRLNVERMIYLSSVAVVSGNPQIPLEEDLPYKATGPYGESKVEAEKKVLEFRRKGLRSVILRPCMVYGKDEPHTLGLLCFLLKYRLLPLIDEGRKKLHLVYVKNVVEAMIYSLKKEEFLQGTFFVADNEVLNIKEIFDIISKTLGAKSAWNLPPFIKPILLRTPFIGKKMIFFLKDRVYSTVKVKSLGLKFPYSTREAFTRSIRHFST